MGRGVGAGGGWLRSSEVVGSGLQPRVEARRGKERPEKFGGVAACVHSAVKAQTKQNGTGQGFFLLPVQ